MTSFVAGHVMRHRSSCSRLTTDINHDKTMIVMTTSRREFIFNERHKTASATSHNLIHNRIVVSVRVSVCLFVCLYVCVCPEEALKPRNQAGPNFARRRRPLNKINLGKVNCQQSKIFRTMVCKVYGEKFYSNIKTPPSECYYNSVIPRKNK